MNRNLPPAVKNIIMLNVILFCLTWMLPSILQRWGVELDLTKVLGMHYFSAQKFNLAQMLTYMFMHAPFPNIYHILFNMFAVFMFGPILEQIWGSRKFLIYYLVVGIGAGLVQQLFWYVEFGQLFSAFSDAIRISSYEPLEGYMEQLSKYFTFYGDISDITTAEMIQMRDSLQNSLLTVGASGSVFGLLLAFGWLFPEEKLFLLFIPYPIKARYFVAGYAVIELFLGVANFSGDSVAHFAHLGGMLFGILFILYWKKKGRLYTA